MAPSTKSVKMGIMYRQTPNIEKSLFLTSFFKTKDGDITNADSISIDIERTDEDISPVLIDISTGANAVSQDIFTNKTLRPPAHAEKMPFNVYDLFNRMPGETEYQAADADFQVKLRTKVLKSWEKLQNRIKRSIELQASQVLQTGTITLKNAAGTAAYTLDYQPNTTHFPTVTTSWSDVSSDAMGDVDALAQVIRNNGLVDPGNLIFGSGAWLNFKKNTAVLAALDNRRIDVGMINPQMLNSGATYQGHIWIGEYRYDMWTYGGRYLPVGSSTKTQYVTTDKVIMLPKDLEDLDFRKAFAGIPVVVDSDPRYRDILPAQVSVPGAFAFKPRIYTDQEAETVWSEIKSRPLLIPVSIDRYGCLTTTAV